MEWGILFALSEVPAPHRRSWIIRRCQNALGALVEEKKWREMERNQSPFLLKKRLLKCKAFFMQPESKSRSKMQAASTESENRNQIDVGFITRGTQVGFRPLKIFFFWRRLYKLAFLQCVLGVTMDGTREA